MISDNLDNLVFYFEHGENRITISYDFTKHKNPNYNCDKSSVLIFGVLEEVVNISLISHLPHVLKRSITKQCDQLLFLKSE